MHPRFLLAIRISIACLAVGAIFYWIDFRRVLSSIVQSEWRHLITALVITYIDRYVMVYKWAMLLRARGVVISTFEALRIYLLSGFVGMFLPTSVGADVVKLARTTLSTGKAANVTASILMERVLGLLALSLLAVVGLAYLLKAGERQFIPTFYFVCAVVGSVVLLLILSLRRDLSQWIAIRLAAFNHYRIVRGLLNAYQEYISLGDHKGLLSQFFVLSLLEHLLSAIIGYYGGLALNYSISFLHFVAIIPVVTLLGMVPISIGGIGIKEGLFVLFFALAGISGEQALSLALLMRAIDWIMLVPGGLFFLQETLQLPKSYRNG